MYLTEEIRQLLRENLTETIQLIDEMVSLLDEYNEALDMDDDMPIKYISLGD